MKTATASLIAAALIAPALASVPITAQAKQAKPVSTAMLERQWIALEQECRGGNHTPEDAVCRKRDAVLNELERRGICWAYRDESVRPYQYDWHPCSQRRPR